MIHGDQDIDANAHFVIDSVPEMISIGTSHPSLSHVRSPASKARLRIRTLPRECNPTPQPLKLTTWNSGSKKAPSAQHVAFSPKTSNNFAELELSYKADPFDDLTETKMRTLCKVQDLEDVTCCTISIDSRKQSTELIGQFLPSLQRLQFCQSFIVSFRDLGTSLRALKILDARECGIKHLDGISALVNLEELYLSYNEISEIDYRITHDQLRLLDLEGNQIADENQVQHLAFCARLREVHLRKNPLSESSHYRQLIATMLPQVKILDGIPLTEVGHYSLCTDTSDEGSGQRDHGQKKLTILASYESRNGRDEVSKKKREEVATNYGSTLTHGTDIVFAGNPTNALRRHRNEIETDHASKHGVDDSITPTVHSPGALINQKLQNLGQGGDYFSFINRRESITDTLDRANEFGKENSEKSLVMDPQMRHPQVSQKNNKDANVPMTDKTVNYLVGNNTKELGSLGLGVDDAAQVLPKLHRNFSFGQLMQGKKSPSLESGKIVHTIDCKSESTALKLGITALSLHEMYSSLKGYRSEASGSHLRAARNGTKTSQDSSAEDEDSDQEDIITNRTAYPGKVSSKPMFNIFHGLRAIDHWNEQFEQGSPKRISQNSFDSATSFKSISKHDGHHIEHVGPANFESDEDLVAIIRGECTLEIDLKTREGFRRYFKGMNATRLQDILKRAFSDDTKVSRRLSLMKGYLRDDASTN